MSLPIYPFDSDRAIGTITEVSGTTLKVNLPQAAAPGSRWHHGHRLDAGRVGEFVVVEASHLAVFGRIIAVRLPEKERLAVQEELGERFEAHPIGIVQMMATASLVDGKIDAGVPTQPRLGARCFSAHPELIKWLAEHVKHAQFTDEPKLLDIAVLPFSTDTHIRISPESLFGRHCAILGAAGGGKSWTVGRLIEQSCAFPAKILLIDATGEFHTFIGGHVKHVHLCKDDEAIARGSEEVALPYDRLTETDLFALFQPSPQSQAPKLRAAMKSLKLAKLDASLAPDGTIRKADCERKAFEDAQVAHASGLESQKATFNISRLIAQIREECIWPVGKPPNGHKFGGYSEQDLGYCVSLIARIEGLVGSSDLACVFRPEGKHDLMGDVLPGFLANKDLRLLVLSLKELAFANSIREVVVNAIGRQMLNAARRKTFLNRPLIVFLDEAHQFTGKTLGDEANRLHLDAFDLIAKEGRKYSLTLCIATQRPRDIGQGILSQMGAYLVHRLTNPEDRELVERAAGDLDRSAASFIPTLAAGQAVLIGIDFPIPVTLQILEPTQKPASSGPKYQQHWSTD